MDKRKNIETTAWVTLTEEQREVILEEREKKKKRRIEQLQPQPQPPPAQQPQQQTQYAQQYQPPPPIQQQYQQQQYQQAQQPIRAVPIVATAPPPTQRPIVTSTPIEPTVDFFVPPSIQIPKRQRDSNVVATSFDNLPVPTFTQVIADDLQELKAGPSTLPNGVSMFLATTSTAVIPNNGTHPNVNFNGIFEKPSATIQELPDEDGSMTNYTEVSSGGTSHKRRRRRMKNVLVI